MTHRRETGLAYYAGELLQQVGGGVFLDGPVIVADRQDGCVLMAIALAGDEGVKRLEAMHTPVLNQCCHRTANHRRSDSGMNFAQLTKHIAG